MATPASNKRAVSDQPFLVDIAITVTVASKPAMKAATGKAIIMGIIGAMLPAKIITVTAPTAAPLDTPINAGSAKGLRNNACIQTPLAARPIPTTEAVINLGKRIWVIT